MNDREWEKFFELVDKIVDMDMESSAKEKAALFIQKAEENGSTGNWEELIAWFDE